MSHSGPNISDVVAGRVFGSLRGGKCWIYTYKTVLLYVLPTPACNSWKHLKKTCDLSLLAWLPPVSMAVYYCLVEHSSGNTAERNFLNCRDETDWGFSLRERFDDLNLSLWFQEGVSTSRHSKDVPAGVEPEGDTGDSEHTVHMHNYWYEALYQACK